MIIPPVGADLSHADRRTDSHDEANSRFTQFCERDIGAQPTAYRSSDLGINLQDFQPGFLSQCSAKFVNALSCGATALASSRHDN